MNNSKKESLVEQLYAYHKHELCHFIIRKFGVSLSEAEDIVQSVFIRFFEMESINDINNHRAFLYKMCSNMTLDVLRHKKITHLYATGMAIDEETFTESGPENIADTKQRLNIIACALRRMPAKQRELLIMSRFDGLSYAEISRQVGRSDTVVRKHISKALAGLQKALGN